MAEVLRVPVYKSTRLFGWALVEAEDYPLVIQWRWVATVKDRYVATWDPDTRKAVLMHRMIMGCMPGDGVEVDHENGNGFDNRRENLRVCSHAQNGQNTTKRAGTTSRFRGVTRSHNGKRWIAQVRFQGAQHYLGTYDTEEEAGGVAAAFRAAHFTHHKERT